MTQLIDGFQESVRSAREASAFMASLRLPGRLTACVLCGLFLSCGTAAPTLSVRRTVPVSHTAPVYTQVRSLGRSVQGRPIRALELSSAPGAAVMLVVGAIHGNEPGGIAIVHRLQGMGPVRGVQLWSVANLNPDGTHAGTRQNADGVDLNRNFPFGWEPIGVRGDQQYSGTHALSEPESRMAERLITTLRPRVTIWFHQPLGVVDESGGDPQIERYFARKAMLPLRRLTRYPGSAAGWQNHSLKQTTAFVVELSGGTLTATAVNRLANAVRDLALYVASHR